MTITTSAGTTAPDRTGGASTSRRPPLWWAGYAACAWTLAYMLPHLYWAAGGTAMLSAFRPAASAEPAFRLINGVASAMMIGAAIVAFALTRRPVGRMLHWVLLAVAWAGSVLSIAHGIYGIADRALVVTGVNLVESQQFAPDEHAWILWDLLVFEPWFLIEGILFGLAGWASLTRPRDRRLWVGLIALGVLGALVAALFRVRVA